MTALDTSNNPAVGVVVHFTVTGVHAQSVDVTTGADGKATFSYTGVTIGPDKIVASATIVTAPVTTDPTATYDSSGNQTAVTDPTGTTHTVYDDNNLPTTFTDRLGHVTTIDYDDRHVPKRFSDEIGTRFTFTNSEQGLPLTVDDAVGHRAYLEYDAAGNVTARTDSLGRVTRATYDEGGNKLTEMTARGGVTQHIYTADGQLQFTRDAEGYERTTSHDANGSIYLEYDNVGRQTNSTYNALNQLTQVTHFPEGETVTFEYDFRGKPTRKVDESHHETRYVYDLAGNLIETRYFLNDGTFRSEVREYDELNRLKSVTDELGAGHKTTYAYEPGCGCSDRVTSVTDPLGHGTATGYDANGRRSSVTDANSHTTTFEYDVRGHLTDTHYPDGTSTHEEYDTRGRRTSMTDQTHVTTGYGYDDQGQLTSVTDPLNNVTQYGYDADGNLTSVTDANNHTTAYEYDFMKRKTKRTLPLNQFETFVYDPAGRQTSHKDFRGKTTNMTYDGRDRMLTKVPDATLGEPSCTFTYWPTGVRKSMSRSDGVGNTTYGYDERDRLTAKSSDVGTLTYTYYDNGNLKTIVSSNDNGASDHGTDVLYAWDAANQLQSITDYRLGTPGVGVTTTATYTPTRLPSTLSQPNGIGLTYSYDAVDRVTSMLWRQGTSAPFGTWSYGYNNRGQRNSSTDITGRAATYGYDDASRLASETITNDPRGASFNGGVSYVIDGAGNRMSRTSNLAAIASASYSYNANDELGSEAYDANGNTTSFDGHSFSYDFENRLVSKDSGALTITYDCDGNRVAKTIGDVTTRYLVDDLNPTGYLQVLEEVVGGAVQTRYTYGTSLVSQTRDISTTPGTSYYGFDGHGSITFLTDTTGSVVASYDYDAFGNLIASTGSTSNTRLFAGEEFDPDIGLFNLRARQYRPGAGRFLTIDPLDVVSLTTTPQQIGDLALPPYARALFEVIRVGSVPAGVSVERALSPASLHRYGYASGDPIDRVDPSGLADAAEYGIFTKIRQQVAPAAVRLGRFVVCEFQFTLHMIKCASLPDPADQSLCMEEAFGYYVLCKEGVVPTNEYWN